MERDERWCSASFLLFVLPRTTDHKMAAPTFKRHVFPPTSTPSQNSITELPNVCLLRDSRACHIATINLQTRQPSIMGKCSFMETNVFVNPLFIQSFQCRVKKRSTAWIPILFQTCTGSQTWSELPQLLQPHLSNTPFLSC